MKNAEKKPNKTVIRSKFSKLISVDRIDLNIPPKIRGTTIKKENLAAFSLSIPITTAVAIVAPLLDIPGRIAIA